MSAIKMEILNSPAIFLAHCFLSVVENKKIRTTSFIFNFFCAIVGYHFMLEISCQSFKSLQIV